MCKVNLTTDFTDIFWTRINTDLHEIRFSNDGKFATEGAGKTHSRKQLAPITATVE